MSDYSYDNASSSDITVWAALECTDGLESEQERRELDRKRLEIIKKVIKSEVDANGPVRSSGDSSAPTPSETPNESVAETMAPTEINCGNRLALLRSRNANYQDGRARFPVFRAAVYDRGMMKKECEGVRPINELICFGGERNALKSMNLSEEISIFWDVLKMISVNLLLVGLPFVYLIRVRHGEKLEEIMASILGLMGIISVPIFGIWVQYFKNIRGARPYHRQKSIRELEREAGNDVRAKIEVAVSKIGRAYYARDGLSFAGGQFIGDHQYQGTVTLQSLFLAGYTTTYDRGGREVLVGPAPYFRAVRLHTMNRLGKAIFSNVRGDDDDDDDFMPVSDEQLEKEVLPIEHVVGRWKQQVDVGRLNE